MGGKLTSRWALLERQAQRAMPVRPFGRRSADRSSARDHGEDPGQAGWITADEARSWFDLLHAGPDSHALEVACGSGGVTCLMARETGASTIGIDVNPRAIESASERARREKLEDRVAFHALDAGKPFPLADASFDAVFCNDSINHLPGRPDVLRDWFRLLRPRGRILFTDPIVVTGQLSNEEIRIRSSIGYFLFTPAGHNERLLEDAGFSVVDVQDTTASVVSVSKKWRDARARRRDRLVVLEGDEGFEGLQRFLDVVYRLSSEGRLSRFTYLAERAN